MALYIAIFHGNKERSDGSLSWEPHDVALAAFFDRDAAEVFARVENDECQCHVVDVFELSLIDNYGYPFPARELETVFPNVWKMDEGLSHVGLHNASPVVFRPFTFQ